MPIEATSQVDEVIDHQLDVLVHKGYPALAGLSESGLRALAEPVRAAVRTELAAAGRTGIDLSGVDDGHVPLLLVTRRDVVPAEQAMPLTALAGSTRPGIVDRNHGEGDLAGYLPIDAVTVPDAPMYAVLDLERGEEFCGVRPVEALPVVLSRGRTPLTIDEGVALITQYPQVLARNRCFMLSGSRRHDKRVPALWIGDRAHQARLVLGRQPALVVGHRVGRPPAGVNRTARATVVRSGTVHQERAWRRRTPSSCARCTTSTRARCGLSSCA